MYNYAQRATCVHVPGYVYIEHVYKIIMYKVIIIFALYEYLFTYDHCCME